MLDNLVTSGSYHSGHGDDKNLTKVNLLNAAERDEICSSIVNSLEMINTNLYILSFRIQYMTWSQFFLEYDPETGMIYDALEWRRQRGQEENEENLLETTCSEFILNILFE